MKTGERIAAAVLLLLAASLVAWATVSYVAATKGKGLVVTDYRYENGMHTFTGAVETPSECHILRSAAAVEGTAVELRFTTENGKVVCATETPTAQTFLVSVIAPPNATFVARVNGEPVPLTVSDAE